MLRWAFVSNCAGGRAGLLKGSPASVARPFGGGFVPCVPEWMVTWRVGGSEATPRRGGAGEMGAGAFSVVACHT